MILDHFPIVKLVGLSIVQIYQIIRFQGLDGDLMIFDSRMDIRKINDFQVTLSLLIYFVFKINIFIGENGSFFD